MTRRLRSGNETWAWEIQVGVSWSDRYNSDRDYWLNVRIDREGSEFHRHTGRGH